MKLARTAMTAAVLAGVCLGAWAQAPKLEGLDIVLDAVPAGPVALVNNQPIPSEEFVELYKGELTRYQQMRPQDTISDAFRIGLALRCMRTLIEKELLLQEAEKRDVTISDEVVEQRWAKEIENIGKQLSQNKDKPLTEEEVLKEAGAKRENAIAELREALLIEKMREIIAKDQGVTVTDDEVKKQFEEMNKDGARPSDRAHMRQIFLRAPAGAGGAASSARETARNKAQEALSRIRAGRNFEAVAKEVSDEPFRSKGGDLGPARIDTMPDFMAEAARSLKPGEMSGVIESDFGILGCHSFRRLQEFAVRGLDHIGFGHSRNPLDAVFPGILKGQAHNPLRAGGGYDLEVHRQIIGDMQALAAQDVLSLGVLPEEDPVYALVRHLDRPDIGEEVQLPAHGDIGALQIGPLVSLLWRCKRPLQYDMALLQCRQHILGKGLHHLYPRFNVQAGDIPQLYLARCNLIRQHILEHPDRLLGDVGADAVAPHHADDYGLEAAVVGPILSRLYLIHAQ